MMAPCDPTDEIVEKLGLTKFSRVLKMLNHKKCKIKNITDGYNKSPFERINE